MLGKFLTLYIWLKHPSIPSPQRWFIRFNYLGRLYQLKNLFRDYIIKKPYKVISFNGEFQQELIKIIPHAYWHYKNGTLLKTISAKHMMPFYYFSPAHEERFSVRNYKDNFTLEVPNAPHNIKLDKTKWAKVPLKNIYRNSMFLYRKPILVISNRYNTEWGKEPISFFDIDILDFLLRSLQEKYQVIYNRPYADTITNDNSEIRDLGDYHYIKERFPQVLIMQDLFNIHKDTITEFNKMQLMVYANCENFISIHGGTATLASYFGGINLIYSVEGHEHYLNEFTQVFTELSDAQIFVSKKIEDLKIQAIKLFGTKE